MCLVPLFCQIYGRSWGTMLMLHFISLMISSLFGVFVCARTCIHVCDYACSSECHVWGGQRKNLKCNSSGSIILSVWGSASHWSGSHWVAGWQWALGNLPVRFLVLGLQAYSTKPVFSHGSWGLNSGPHACSSATYQLGHLPSPCDGILAFAELTNITLQPWCWEMSLKSPTLSLFYNFT